MCYRLRVTDVRTHGRTDGQDLLQRCVAASKNVYCKQLIYFQPQFDKTEVSPKVVDSVSPKRPQEYHPELTQIVTQSICQSVGRSIGLGVGQSFGQSVGQSVGRSIGWSVGQCIGNMLCGFADAQDLVRRCYILQYFLLCYLFEHLCLLCI